MSDPHPTPSKAPAPANTANGAPLNPQPSRKTSEALLLLIAVGLIGGSFVAYQFMGKILTNNINKINAIADGGGSTFKGFNDGGFEESTSSEDFLNTYQLYAAGESRPGFLCKIIVKHHGAGINDGSYDEKAPPCPELPRYPNSAENPNAPRAEYPVHATPREVLKFYLHFYAPDKTVVIEMMRTGPETHPFPVQLKIYRVVEGHTSGRSVGVLISEDTKNSALALVALQE